MGLGQSSVSLERFSKHVYRFFKVLFAYRLVALFIVQQGQLALSLGGSTLFANVLRYFGGFGFFVCVCGCLLFWPVLLVWQRFWFSQ